MKIISARESGVFNEADEWCEGWEVSVTFTEQEISDLLAVYDPSSSTSPSVSYCRPIVKEILDSILSRG
jgi:hypothetical protein